jgi:hypothetical protein
MGVGVAASMSSPQGSWSMINQFQIFILLPMLGAYMPFEVINFITGMGFTLFSFDFIPYKEIPGIKHTIQFLDYDQTDEYLDEVGIESGSSLINHISLILIFGLIGIAHVIIIPIHSILKRK